MTIQEALNLATQHHQAGRLADAEALYRKILTQFPDSVDASLGMAITLRDQRQMQQAIFYAHQAATLQPKNPQTHNILGYVYFGQGRYEEALAAFRQMLALSPSPAAHNNVGMALYGLRRMDECIAAFNQALALAPNYPDAENNLGNALVTIGEHDKAIPLFESALRQRPDYASAHWNLGLALLIKGDFQRGWPEYEWRWKVQDFYLRRSLPKPLWDGAPLNGRTLFLYSEQGFGDAIQFIRYIPRIAEGGGKILVVCQKELVPLLRQLKHVDQWLTLDQRLPDYDVHCSLLSLPMVMGTNLTNIPADIPYLTADPDRKKPFTPRLPTDGRLKVGIAWAGGTLHDKDRARSFPLSTLSPLAALPNVWLASLQKGDPAAQIATAGIPLIDFANDLNDFADTAALIDQLDLVITADTAVAHVAGTMGKPVWVLLPYSPDWRWMLHRTDSPWYPSMKLFRQTALGNWTQPLAEIVKELKQT